MNTRTQASKPSSEGCPWPPDNWVYPHTINSLTGCCVWCSWTIDGESSGL